MLAVDTVAFGAACFLNSARHRTSSCSTLSDALPRARRYRALVGHLAPGCAHYSVVLGLPRFEVQRDEVASLGSLGGSLSLVVAGLGFRRSTSGLRRVGLLFFAGFRWAGLARALYL